MSNLKEKLAQARLRESSRKMEVEALLKSGKEAAKKVIEGGGVDLTLLNQVDETGSNMDSVVEAVVSAVVAEVVDNRTKMLSKLTSMGFDDMDIDRILKSIAHVTNIKEEGKTREEFEREVADQMENNMYFYEVAKSMV